MLLTDGGDSCILKIQTKRNDINNAQIYSILMTYIDVIMIEYCQKEGTIMKIKLLIATPDTDYAEFLSSRIAERHMDAADVSVCSSLEGLQDSLMDRKFDAALLEASLLEGADLCNIQLPLLLWTEDMNASDTLDTFKKIRKYQRVSSIVSCVQEQYAKVATDGRGFDQDKAHISVVWSPAGGVGKTTVALAYAAKKVSEGKRVLYLDLELFSSSSVYFDETGKGISTIFEMLENHEGNIKILIQGIRRYNSETGIAYFCRPDNFDDMNILTSENVSVLIDACACAGATDELVIDMSCLCDERTQRIFDLADRVFLVTDMTTTSQTKLYQFATQHHIFENIRNKAIHIANKSAALGEPLTDTVISLPYVQTANAAIVYRTLVSYRFE